jgi:diacylglycerol kinase (ATP)
VEGSDTRVDLGIVEVGGEPPRCFVNSAGIGFDAVVARRVQSRGGAGTVPYLLATIGALWRHQPLPAEVEIDGKPVWAGRTTAIVVANGPAYGGGMKIAPGATPDDGWLDVIVAGDLGRAELLAWFPSVYRGRHLRHHKIVARRARTVVVRAPGPLPIHVDGEAAGETPVVIRVRAGALRLRR